MPRLQTGPACLLLCTPCPLHNFPLHACLLRVLRVTHNLHSSGLPSETLGDLLVLKGAIAMQHCISCGLRLGLIV